MPIPLSNMEKNIQTPNASKGEALNLSREAATSVQMANEFASTISNGIKSAGQAFAAFKASEQNAKDLTTANEAYNLYMTQMEDLNSTRSSMSGAQAVAFEKDYNTLAQKYQSQFIDTIENKVSNSKVRENVREHANSYNLKNRENAFLFFDKQKKDYQVQTSNAAAENKVNNAKANFVNGAAENNAAQMKDLLTDLDADEIAIASAQGYALIPDNGYLTPEQKEINRNVEAYLQQVIQARRQKALNEITRDLDEKNTDLRPWKSSASSIKLVTDMRDAGYIDASFADAKLKELENDQYRVELKRRPNQFWDPNSGRFLSENRKKNCPHLTQEEYEQAAKTVTEKGAGKGGLEKELSQDSAAYLYNILASNGLAAQAPDLAKYLGRTGLAYEQDVAQSNAAYAGIVDDTATVTKMYRLLDAAKNGKVIVSEDGAYSSADDIASDAVLPKGQKLVNIVDKAALQSTMANISAMMNKSIDVEGYNRALATKVLSNNKPTGSQVSSAVAGAALHDLQTISNWQKFKRWVTRDKSKIPNLGPILNTKLTAAMQMGYEARMHEYGKNPDELENDSLSGRIIYKQDASGKNIPETGILYDDLAALGMTEGIIKELGAEGARQFFGGGKEAVLKAVKQSQKDFMQKMNAQAFAASGTGGVVVWTNPPKRAEEKAARTNSLIQFAQGTDNAVKKNAAETLAETNSDGVNIPEKITAEAAKIKPYLPFQYTEAGNESFERYVHEKLWGNVQYAQLPDYDTYSRNTPGNPDSYRNYLNTQIESDRLYGRLQNDGMFQNIEDKLELYRTQGGVSQAIYKRYKDYMTGSGVYSNNVREANLPTGIDPLGNITVETKPSEFTAFSVMKPNDGWVEQKSVRKPTNKPKLYLVDANKQYYFDSEGVPHEYNLPSNDVFTTIMMMKGKNYPAAQKRQFTTVDFGQQYVNGGAFQKSVGLTRSDAFPNVDFTF